MCINIVIRINPKLDGKRANYGNPNDIDWVAEGVE